MTLKNSCEQSFLTELHHFESSASASSDRTLVMDTVSGRIYYRKILKVYHLSVYRYLSEHANPHIPRICCFHEENGCLTVLEEPVHGRTLEYLLLNENPDREEKLAIADGICEGLSFLHHAGPPIIHRDIKASNIMVTDDGVVMIIDYDAARSPAPGETRDTILMGTPGSAAPEQYGFGPSDCRTDIYALGVLLRDMFPGDSKIQKIAAQATRIDPADRYYDVDELRRQLRYAGGTAANAAGTSAAHKTAAKHLPVLIAAAAAVSVALLLLAFGLMSSRTKDNASSAAVSSAGSSTSAASSQVPAPTVIESGYHTTVAAGYTHVYCGMKIENPDAGKAVENPIMTITARAADGHILASDNCPIPGIAAGDVQWYGYDLQYEEGEQPVSVDFSVSDPGDFVNASAPGIFSPDDFVFSDVRSSEVTGGRRFTGEITNRSAEDAGYISIMVIYYADGKIIGGNYADCNAVPAGKTLPFDFEVYGTFPCDSCDLHALGWAY